MDYTSHPSLVAGLRDVEIVINVLLIPGPDWVTTQLKLLHAAEEAGCRCFVRPDLLSCTGAQARVDLLDAKYRPGELFRVLSTRVK